MNSVVSIASVASATAVSSPSIAADQLGGVSFKELANQFDRLHAVYVQMALDDQSRRENNLPDNDHDLKRWSEFFGQLTPITQAILEQPARSLADLAFQARVVALENYELWTEKKLIEYGLDGDQISIRLFTEKVAEFTNTELLPGLQTYPLEMESGVEEDKDETETTIDAAEDRSDPIFDLIDGHRKAMEKFARWNSLHSKYDSELGTMNSRCRWAEKRMNNAYDRAVFIFRDVVISKPTTWTGLVAKLDYIEANRENKYGDGLWMDPGCPDERDDAFFGLAASIREWITPVSRTGSSSEPVS